MAQKEHLENVLQQCLNGVAKFMLLNLLKIERMVEDMK